MSSGSMPLSTTASEIKSAAPAGQGFFLDARAALLGDLAHRVGRLLHRARVHAAEILAHDPEREQLGAREDGDHRSEEGEARDTATRDQGATDAAEQADDTD